MSETATLDIVIESEFVSETSGGDLDVFTVELYWRRAAELDWSILIGHWGYIWSATGKSKERERNREEAAKWGFDWSSFSRCLMQYGLST